MKVFFLIPFLLAACCLSAQNRVSDTSATFIAYWRKGETKKLQITHTSEKFFNGKSTGAGSGSYTASLQVLDSTEKEYTLQWTYHEIKTKGLDPLSQSMAAATNGLKIVYTTDELGAFREVVNLEEVNEYVKRSVEAMAAKSTDPQLKPMIRELQSWLTKKEAVQLLVLREIRLYHMPYGGQYRLNEKLRSEVALPNISGGEPFPAVLEVELRSIDRHADRSHLSITQQLDKKKGARILFELLNRLTSAAGQPLEREQLLQQVEMTDENGFDLVLSTGWLSRAFMKRTAVILESRKIDTYEIVMLD